MKYKQEAETLVQERHCAPPFVWYVAIDAHQNARLMRGIFESKRDRNILRLLVAVMSCSSLWLRIHQPQRLKHIVRFWRCGRGKQHQGLTHKGTNLGVQELPP